MLYLVAIFVVYLWIGFIIASTVPGQPSATRVIKIMLLWLPGFMFDRVFLFMDN